MSDESLTVPVVLTSDPRTGMHARLAEDDDPGPVEVHEIPRALWSHYEAARKAAADAYADIAQYVDGQAAAR